MNLSRCCQGSVDPQNSLRWIEKSVENLLSKQRAKKFGLMDQEAAENVSSRNPESLMDRESVEMLLRKE